ncbi:MAG TPA: TonB-dependent receptor [Candidatus Eremiobacteraceae bacterium]|nr:TonB-dependent receptor [Candidatus Eremiobacteraceae bacterium]
MSRSLLCALAVAVLGAVLLVALPSGPVAAGTTGSISGHVVDDKGNPVAAVHVVATSASQSASALTDSHGFYSILNLSPDTYSLTGSKDGYDSVTLSGVTVQADQNTGVDLTIRPSVKVLAHVTTSANASVVSRTVTGDLYAVNAQAINSYQGSAGGAETLYSQNSVVGSLPGVIRSVGSGGGYAGNGTLSMRGGTSDQIGFELEGIPLNRSFDAANGTSFVTNGLAALEVYTGGEPADAGRSMSGYINEQIRRGSYPGGADLTGVFGGPDFNHTLQSDMYGGTPNGRFTWYVSTLASNAAYNFSDSHNLDGHVINIAANDPTCAAFNDFYSVAEPCGQSFSLPVPISQAAFWGLVNPSAAIRDTVANLHFAIDHNGLADDVQALYNVGTTYNPFLYSGWNLNPVLADATNAAGQVVWPSGTPYIGALNQQYNPNAFGLLTWPSANDSTGPIPVGRQDDQQTQSSIEKLSYTRELTSSSFLRFYTYSLYSLWNFDQPTNPYVGDSFYDLHDNETGYTLNYQNQLSEQHLLRIDVDYLKDITLRYNYAPDFFSFDDAPDQLGATNIASGNVLCGDLATATLNQCGTTGAGPVAFIGEPYAYWNKLPEIDSDVALADSWHASDRLLVDLGARMDRFDIQLTPLQVTGPDGIAEQAQNEFGTCLDGYAYATTDPCYGYLTDVQSLNTPGSPSVAPGAANWQNVSGSLVFSEFSPRVGLTYTLPDRDVLRFSVGRYVEPANTYGEEYISAPYFGAGDTVSVLNNFYDGLGFLAVHDVKPQDSTNYDASYERDFGGGWSAKLTPFYRNTRNQILSIPVTPNNPTFVTGYNFGAARIDGSEFLVRRNRSGANGLSTTLTATYTDSKIRFERTLGATNFIDTINEQITNYNQAYGTNYPLFDSNAFYSPSETQSFGSFTPSFDVRWVANLIFDERVNGFDIAPTFNYQSGNPYGDPLDFPDFGPQSCLYIAAPCVKYGPDPYTHQFDGLGSLVGPSWVTMNLAISHNIAPKVVASFLVTNVFTAVHNHGYPWEYPTGDQVLAYGDNQNYYNGLPFPVPYQNDGYYPYAPSSLNPVREYVFSLSTKL